MAESHTLTVAWGKRSAAPGIGCTTRIWPKAIFTPREDDAWRVTCTGEDETISLFEIAHPNVDDCMLIYRARIRSEGVGGRAYLEMWCRFSAGREFFSKGFAFHEPVTGTTEWTVCETPFYLKRGQKPSLVTLNLVVQGGGDVWIKDVQLLRAPFVLAGQSGCQLSRVS